MSEKVWTIIRYSSEMPVFCMVASTLEAALQWLKVDTDHGLARNKYYYRLSSFIKIDNNEYHVPYTIEGMSKYPPDRYYYELKCIDVFSYTPEKE